MLVVLSMLVLKPVLAEAVPTATTTKIVMVGATGGGTDSTGTVLRLDHASPFAKRLNIFFTALPARVGTRRAGRGRTCPF